MFSRLLHVRRLHSFIYFHSFYSCRSIANWQWVELVVCRKSVSSWGAGHCCLIGVYSTADPIARVRQGVYPVCAGARGGGQVRRCQLRGFSHASPGTSRYHTRRVLLANWLLDVPRAFRNRLITAHNLCPVRATNTAQVRSHEPYKTGDIQAIVPLFTDFGDVDKTFSERL